MFDRFRIFIKRLGLESIARAIYVRFIPLLYRDKISRGYSNPYSELEDHFKVVFVHVPKNAGNGFSKSLFGMKPRGHNFASRYKKFDGVKYSNYFKFGLTRDVHARFYSAYRYLVKGGFGVYDIEFRDRYLCDLSFNEFVLKLGRDTAYARKVMSWTHFIPQVDFLTINGVCELDYVGSVENMDATLKVVSKELSLTAGANTLVNASGAGPEDYRDEYSSDSYEIISRLYSDDIKFISLAR